jgi:Ca-activated chloride channel homolog
MVPGWFLRRALPVLLPALGAVAVPAAGRPSATPPPQQTQQPQQPVFRTGVETVAVYATVLDQYGEIARNLTRDDFEVFDNGRRQKLTVFVAGLQPITAILLLDTSESMTLSLDQAREAAEQFIIRMLPGDTARVGSFSDEIRISPSFTGDRDALLREVRDDLHIGNPTRLWDAVAQAMGELAPLGGRRIIMLLTDGNDTFSHVSADDVLTRARADELMVYAIQFSTTRLARRQEEASLPMPSIKEELLENPHRNLPAPQALRRIAAQTGGGFFSLAGRDDVNAAFERVTDELHYQYVLGFSPQTFDGKIHDLDVRVRHQGMTVRARRTYLAPKPPVRRAP